MSPKTEELSNWMGRQVNGRDGNKIGKIDDIYLDDRTGEPEWLAITTGLFGTRRSFVPLADARMEGDDVMVPYDKDMVKDAPNAEHDGHLSPEEEERLYHHYGVRSADTGRTTDKGRTADKGRSTDDAMTRSEEELKVGKTSQETGKARLRKWVETENVTRTVPVSREEVRVEREPVTEGNVDEAMSGPEISEGEHTEVLHEEHAVTNKEVVPKERVRLDKETVTDEEQVSEEVRKERVAVEGDAKDSTRRR
jgi:uncharacterized protein (TIGR02271 family)